MLKTKLRLREDENDGIDFESGLPSRCIEDLWDQYVSGEGPNIFSDENIQMLKDMNMIDEETGMPITQSEEEDEPHVMDFEDLRDLIHSYGLLQDSNYLKDLFIKKVLESLPEDKVVNVSVWNLDGSGGLSRSFVLACFHEDIYDRFMDNIYDLDKGSVADYVESKMSDKNKELLKKLGFPEDVFNQIAKKDFDDLDELTQNYFDEIYNCGSWACDEALCSGAESECLSDFNSALENCAPTGCEYVGKDLDKDDVLIKLSEEYIKSDILDIWDRLGYHSSAIYDCTCASVTDDVAYIFNFREPYYGWHGFDEDSFNDSLEWRLKELEDTIQKDKERSKEATESLNEDDVDGIDLDIANDLPNISYYLDELTLRQLIGLINLHGKKNNVWSLDIHDKDADIWHSGNVYETGNSEFDGYFTFEDAYNKFLNYNLKDNESISIIYNPLNKQDELKICCTRHE